MDVGAANKGGTVDGGIKESIDDETNSASS